MAEEKKTSKKPRKAVAKNKAAFKNTLLYEHTKTRETTIEDFKEFDRSKKVRKIIEFMILLLGLIYCVFVFVANYLWPETVLGKVLLMPNVPEKNFVVTGILATVFYIMLIFGISDLITHVVYFFISKKDFRAVTVARLIGSALRYTALLVSLFIILNCWGVNTATILASAGILAVIIGLGAQTLMADILAGVAIVWEDQFRINDIVIVDDFRGTVKEIGLTITKIEDWAGNIKNIHNSCISACVNLSRKNSFAETTVDVDYSTDLGEVRKLLEENLPEISKRIPSIVESARFLGVSKLGESGITLAFIACCEERERFGVARALNEELFKLFQQNGITIPFPQVTISSRDKK